MIEDWGITAGVVISMVLAIGPWMFKVHAKLAVIATETANLCRSLKEAARDHRKLWEVCSRHQSRLDTHDVQIAHLAEELKDGK